MEKQSIKAEHDYYRILGIDSNATHAEIRRAFRVLALRCHPDQNPGDPFAEEKFKTITSAYKVLINPKTRANYDRVRNASRLYHRKEREESNSQEAEQEQPSAAAHQAAKTARASSKAEPKAERKEEDRRKPWWVEEENRTAAKSSSAPPPPPPPPPKPEAADGADIEVDMPISEEVAEFGSKQLLAVSRYENCSVCSGTGGKPGTSVRQCPECKPQEPSSTCRLCAGRGHLIEVACPSCFGRGRSRVTKTFVINVPRRAKSGQKVRVAGEGTPGQGKGKPGDLAVRFVVKPREDYEQRDSTVYSEIYITPQTAAQGGVVRVKTVDGLADLVVPPRTKSGTVFRLEGRGPVLQGKERADHFVTVKIVVP